MTEEDKEKDYHRLLELTIDELRRLYDFMDRTYDGLRTKALALLAGEVAILTFLFASDGRRNPILANPSDYIFLGIGVTALILAFLTFLWILQPVQWEHPPESRDLRDLKDRYDNNSTRYLESLKNHYLDVIPSCNSKITKKSGGFVRAIYLLVVGIVIVAVLKYGNGGLTL